MKITLFVPLVLVALFSFTTYHHPLFIAHRDTDDSSRYQAKFLDLSQRGLKSLPSDIHLYRFLEELDLSNNPIEVLGDGILALPSLRVLKLNQCHYLDVSAAAEIISKTQIEHLEWNHSTLVTVPSAFFSNKYLKKLFLRENHISHFPPEIAVAGRLQVLDLADNQIDTIPHEIKAMKWLVHLDLSNNPCLQRSRSCAMIGKLKNVRSLKLDSIRSLPDNFSHLQDLGHLSIANSPVSVVPPHLTALTSVELVNCDQLDVAGLFTSLATCVSLRELTLSSKHLTQLPENITVLKDLEKLTIRENTLTSLPASFNRMPALKVLAIRLPAQVERAGGMLREIAGLKLLDTLDLSFSALTSLPSSITSVKSIKVLSLEGVSLSELPPGFTNMKNLIELNLRGTLMTGMQIEELQKKLPACNIICDQPYAVPSAVKEEFYSQREKFQLSTERPGTVTTLDGSVIRIPANAFVYPDGKKVKGDVTLSFRPFYSPAQIYMSGISMNYDSGGVRNSFMSAGMFDIRAEAGGRQLELASQKNIQVDFRSTNSTRNFNFYRYDSTIRNWTYKGTDTIIPKSEKTSSVKIDLPPPEREFPLPPIRPRRGGLVYTQGTTGIYYSVIENRNRKKYTFWIERGYGKRGKVYDTTGKEIKIRDEVPDYVDRKSRWVYETDSAGENFFDARNKAVNEFFVDKGSYKYKNATPIKYLRAAANTSVDIRIVPDKDNDRFRIVFYQMNDSVVLSGYPEYRTPSASAVQANTRKEYQQYLADRAKREEKEQSQWKKFLREFKEYEIKMESYREELRMANADELSELNNLPVSEDRITRSLKLDGLGSWNCDIIYSLKNGQELLARLFVNGKQVQPVSITVIDQTNNGYGSFGTSKIIVDRFVNNVLVAKLRDGTFAFTKFTVAKKGTTEIQLAMNVIDTKNLTMAEFSRQVFN